MRHKEAAPLLPIQTNERGKKKLQTRFRETPGFQLLTRPEWWEELAQPHKV